jgi:segregation and condensation protein B
MASPSLPLPSDDEPALSGRLSRSYGAILRQRNWEVDGPEQLDSLSVIRGPDVHAEGAPPIARIVEALLFVGGLPLTAARAAEAVRGLTPAQFAEAIDTLVHDYRRQGRPYTIRARGEGYVLALRPRYRPIVEKLYGTTREARLSAAAIDVLSLVAYRQPVTKQEIDSLRGAECGALLRQLVRRGLIAVVPRADAPRREASFGTTARFLKLFGLKSLDDLPQTQDLQSL